MTDGPRLNPRQVAILHGLRNDLQVAEGNYKTAQQKMDTFLALVKAQFDLPEELQTVSVNLDGTLVFLEVKDEPTPPAPLSLVQPEEQTETQAAEVTAG